jgi:hypothetical protein
MRSDLVVISWWSNCLGLTCLHRLVEHTQERRIYVVQVGKPEVQKARFREHLPPQIEELPYPAGASGEDWRVREVAARELLADRAGVWFIDHDLFLEQDAETWLTEMDQRLEGSQVCLCHATPRRGRTVTNPAFWLSPRRFPPGMPSFARLPYREEPAASRPYAPREAGTAGLRMPEKDTLVAVTEFLQKRDMVCGFPLTESDRSASGPRPFPRHKHIGGLYTFALRIPAEVQGAWVARCVKRFKAFYKTCPEAWVRIEDPVLLQRLEESARL